METHSTPSIYLLYDPDEAVSRCMICFEEPESGSYIEIDRLPELTGFVGNSPRVLMCDTATKEYWWEAVDTGHVSEDSPMMDGLLGRINELEQAFDTLTDGLI